MKQLKISNHKGFTYLYEMKQTKNQSHLMLLHAYASILSLIKHFIVATYKATASTPTLALT